MMQVLVVKTSSLGDVIHTLPAVTDAATAVPEIRFDWVVEEAFAEVPGWHAAVRRVIPVALRRWRRGPLQAARSGEWGDFRQQLRATHYDLVIDAQGLIKSALVTRMAHGVHAGLAADSAREPLAARMYQRRISVPRELHAITRVRRLFAALLDYDCDDLPLDYGLQRAAVAGAASYVVFLHGTTWSSKQWPEASWAALAALAGQQGYAVRLPWGTEAEEARARRIAADAGGYATVLPHMNLTRLAGVIGNALGVVAVDTGPAHLAAALAVPAVTIYGATRAALTGTRGPRQHHLEVEFTCAPCLRCECNWQGPASVTPACYASVPPARVWQALTDALAD